MLPTVKLKLLQHSQLCHKGEFRHISISTQQQSWWCSKNLHRPFLRAILPTTVEASSWVMVVKRKTKALITLPPRWNSPPFGSVDNS